VAVQKRKTRGTPNHDLRGVSRRSEKHTNKDWGREIIDRTRSKGMEKWVQCGLVGNFTKAWDKKSAKKGERTLGNSPRKIFNRTFPPQFPVAESLAGKLKDMSAESVEGEKT